MKILASALACSPRFGSESLVGYRTTEALAERHQTTVISSEGMTGPTGATMHMLPVRFDEPNDVAPGLLWRYEQLQRKVVRQVLREQSFDVVHRVTPSGYKDSLMSVPSVPLVVGPLLGSDPHPRAFDSVFRPQLPSSRSPRALASRFRNGMARRMFARHSTLRQLLERATLILVGTQVTWQRMPSHLRGRCRLLPYAGVEHEVFRPPASGRWNRVPQVLFVGRIVPYKGVELLLRAVAAARKRCEFELKIVGGGPPAYIKYCQQLVTRLRLTEKVSFLGHQPREALPRFYRSADMFCMPSIETYGIAILEAMSSGCAALVGDFNGPGEIVQGQTGIKVPLVSPEQFIQEYAERIVELVGDDRLRTELGEAARERITRLHDWKQIQARLLEIYDEIFPTGSLPQGQSHPQVANCLR